MLMVLGSSCLEETESAARKEGGLCVCKSRVRNLGEIVAFFFFWWDQIGLGETACLEEGSPHSILISAAFHLPPCGRCSACSEAWPGGQRAELRAGDFRAREGWGETKRLESSGKGKENGEKPPPHQGLVIIPAKLRSASPTPTIAAEREAWRPGYLAAGAMF